MNKSILFILSLLTVLLFQNCKKSSTDDTTTTTTSAKLTATINGTAWTPDTLNATITYNAAAKTKVLNITGTISQKQVNMALTLTNATSTNDFTLATYTVDATNNLNMIYSTQQKNTAGAYVFVQHGTVAAGSGSLSVTAVDATQKLLTGTFSFTSKKVTYDSSGVITAIDIANIAGGSFTNLPYTFVSN